jgi:4-amino-4-deoxy-L-arabinose transferase-like glycosyltransferase
LNSIPTIRYADKRVRFADYTGLFRGNAVLTNEVHAAGPTTAMEDPIDRLSSPVAVAIYWVGFGVMFGAIQVLSSSTLTMDTAVTAETVQRQLAPAYQVRNPPLFDWMYFVVQAGFGDAILSHSLLRYSLIAAIGILHYAAFLQVGCNRRLAAAFSYSLIFFVWMASDVHYHFTHSLPLVAAGLATWICAIAYIDRPRVWLAALLGICVGLGIVAKWSFPLPLAGAAIAFALDSRARAAFAQWRSALIPVTAIIPIAPVAYWLATIDRNLISVVHDVLVHTPAPYVDRVGEAVWKYVTSIFLYLLPWPIFVGLISYGTRREARDRGSMHPNGRLAASMTLWTIGLGLAGVTVLGVDNMGMRYMFPVLLTGPIAMAAWVAPRVNDTGFARTTFVVATVVTLVAAVIRLWSFHIVDGFWPANTRQRVPYERLAEELALRGLATAQFVTSGHRDAGNLMAQLPDARAVSVDSVRIEPPPADGASERVCVALWGGNDWKVPGRPRPLRTPEALAPIVADVPGPFEDIVVDWPSPLYGEDRRSIWRVVKLPEDTPACRAARGIPAGRVEP